MAASQVLHGFWREVVYLWRTHKLPRDFFEVSQIWLYRGETACVTCLRASSVDATAVHGYSCCERCAGAARALQATRTGFSASQQT